MDTNVVLWFRREMTAAKVDRATKTSSMKFRNFSTRSNMFSLPGKEI